MRAVNNPASPPTPTSTCVLSDIFRSVTTPRSASSSPIMATYCTPIPPACRSCAFRLFDAGPSTFATPALTSSADSTTARSLAFCPT